MESVRFEGWQGLGLAADVAGPEDGTPVLLFHGGGQTRHAWGTTVRDLGVRGWRTYTVDLRGHGQSDWPDDGNYTLDAFSGDVREIARSLGRRVVLVGASLGGIASLAAVAESNPPIADALVLVDVAPRIENEGRDRIGNFMMERMEEGFASLDEVADAIAAYNPHRPKPKDLEGLRKNLRERDGRWYWHWDPRFISGRLGGSDETRTSLIDPVRLRAAAKSLTIPTLLVRGRLSDLLSEEGVRELKELVPHAEVADIAEAGHMVAGDRNDLFNDAVVSFLEEISPLTP